MKKFFMTLALALGILSVDAQAKDYVDYERGYRADIAMSTSISEQYTLSTSHGFSFGNGLYVGGGVGKTDFFYPRMIAYHRYLTRNGYPHEYLTTSGGHQWYNWEEYCNLFMQRLWK